jgi:hypothetical protein
MHIDHPNWLGMFKEQEDLAAQHPPPDEPDTPIVAADVGEPVDSAPPRLRLVPPPGDKP